MSWLPTWPGTSAIDCDFRYSLSTGDTPRKPACFVLLDVSSTYLHVLDGRDRHA